MALIVKMVSNQWWGDEKLQDEQQKGMHTVKETDMLKRSTKLSHYHYSADITGIHHEITRLQGITTLCNTPKYSAY